MRRVSFWICLLLVLLAAARALSEEVQETRVVRTTTTGSGRPGDEFNRRADWLEHVFKGTGWTLSHEEECVLYMRRPGKETGHSATVNFGGWDRLRVFSTNAAPLEANRWYDKFGVFARLHCGGDFSVAAAQVAALGFTGSNSFSPPHEQLPEQRELEKTKAA